MCYLRQQQFYTRTFNRLHSINKDMGRPQFPYMALVQVNGPLQAEVCAIEGLGKLQRRSPNRPPVSLTLCESDTGGCLYNGSPL